MLENILNIARRRLSSDKKWFLAHFIHYNNRTEDILREGASKTAIGSIYIIIKSEFTDLRERTLFEWILVLVVILIQVRWGCSVRQISLY